MKRKILTIILFGCMALSLVGCGNKEAVSTEDFISIAESKDCEIADASAQYEEYSYVENVTIAAHEEGWQVEFYTLSEDSYATSMFNTNKEIFESYKGNKSVESTTNIGNDATYSLTSDGYYMYLSKVDNTLLYVRVNEDYKDTVKTIIEELEY